VGQREVSHGKPGKCIFVFSGKYDDTSAASVDEDEEQMDRQPAHFSTLFVAIVLGVVILLLLLLIFGVAWKQGR